MARSGERKEGAEVMSIHICTNECLMAGRYFEIETKCAICGTVALHRIGYVSAHCSHCNQYYDPFEWSGYIVYIRRTALKMERRDFAALLGIKRKTLANCETSVCSKRVFDKSLEVFKKLFKTQA